MSQLQKRIRSFLKNSLSIRPHESLLIIAEDSLFTMGEEFRVCADRLAKYSILTKFSYKSFTEHGLPPAISNALPFADTVIFLTPKTAFRSLFDPLKLKKTRMIVVYDNATGLIDRTLQTHYKKIARLSRRLADIFSIGKNINLTSTNGTNANIAMSKIRAYAETGFAHRAGELTFFPAGEACVTIKKNLDGCLVLDRIAGQKKELTKSIQLNVKHGHVTHIKGNDDAERLRRNLRRFGKSGRAVAEIGVGTNSQVTFGTSAQEDEKVLGTAHISLGQDQLTKVKGKMLESAKGIILKPTICIDGRLIIDNGKILV